MVLDLLTKLRFLSCLAPLGCFYPFNSLLSWLCIWYCYFWWILSIAKLDEFVRRAFRQVFLDWLNLFGLFYLFTRLLSCLVRFLLLCLDLLGLFYLFTRLLSCLVKFHLLCLDLFGLFFLFTRLLSCLVRFHLLGQGYLCWLALPGWLVLIVWLIRFYRLGSPEDTYDLLKHKLFQFSHSILT
jgi:hypothetical protein